jgi:hypothetical protein
MIGLLEKVTVKGNEIIAAITQYKADMKTALELIKSMQLLVKLKVNLTFRM